MIDWTQPVETTEDPPRPVRVLATDGPEPSHPIALVIEGCRGIEIATTNGLMLGEPPITLRNVAPSEPVLREAWVAWSNDGRIDGSYSREASAKERIKSWGGVYARAAVMSDGSPVPGEAAGEDEAAADAMIDFAVMAKQRDHWKAKAEALQAEVERMKPVVDAAVHWFNSTFPQGSARLCEAVRTYQSQQAPAEPVKNCTTCAWWDEIPSSTCLMPATCNWEPRHE